MLKITISIIPGGVGAERELGVLHISNVKGGAVATYECKLSSGDSTHPVVHINRYPRWSASVWDLVARAIAKALTGRERLPRRPVPVKVPIHADAATGPQYVRLEEIPEPAKSAFEKHLHDRGVQSAAEKVGCVDGREWVRFIELRPRGGRKSGKRARQNGSGSMEISDRKEEIETLAIQVFGNEDKAMKRLRKPMRQLGGKSPLEASEHGDTAQLAFDLLHSLDHGYLG